MGDKKYLLAVDEGTTSCRAVLFSLFDMRALASFSEPIASEYPRGGWVEQNANDIYLRQSLCIRRIFESSDFSPHEIAAVGITNQRESVVIWDRETGRALAPCVGWQCRRTADECARLRAVPGLADKIKRKTGLVIDAYFTAPKLSWLLKNTPGARAKAKRGELLAGTLDSYLIYRMTGGRTHATDVTNASRTMLFDIHKLAWDKELLELFDIPEGILPEVRECAADYGKADICGARVPIRGVAGDQQASLIGQACFSPGDVKCTYGTGAFLLANTGEEPRVTDSPLITTVAYKIKGKTAYALEGSVFNCASVVNWLKNVGLIDSAADSEVVARGAENSGGTYLVPAFTGLGAPYWDMDCRAAITGITRSTTRNQIVRAGLESIALRCGEVYDLMSRETGRPLGALRADGGVSRNSLVMEMQASVIGAPVYLSREYECTALGAAYLAGMGAGIYDGTDIVRDLHSVERVFEPSGDAHTMGELKAGWRRAVAAVRGERR